MEITYKETISELEKNYLINGEKEIKVTLDSYEKLVSLMFEDTVGLLGDISFGEKKLLRKIVSISIPVEGYEGNIVVLNNEIKEKVALELDFKITTVNMAISALRKHNIITPIEKKSCYMLNPVFFFRGKIGESTKKIRIILEYTII